MGVFSIACYRPKAGHEAALLAAVRDHMPILRTEGLIADRPAYVMRAKDGTIVEIFEWKSEYAIASAHDNAQVRKLWERFYAVCEFVPLASVSETKEMFANFDPIALNVQD